MFLVVTLTSLLSVALGGCPFDLTKLTPQPLVLSSTYQILYPELNNAVSNHTIVVPQGETIIITCPGGHVINGDSKTTPSSILATCNEDQKLIHDDKIVDYNQIKCSIERIESVKLTELSCGGQSKIALIGYEVGLHINFVPLITVCFNHEKQTPIWTNYYLSRSIGWREIENVTEIYVEDKGFYNLLSNFTQLYDLDHQRATINALVGLPAESHKYIDYSPLAMVPLAQPLGFVYRNQINATAHYINTVPVWHLDGFINNWLRLETSLVAYAKSRHIELDIYTGTFGTSSIKSFNIEIPIYLDVAPKGGHSAVPVPELLWKLVYNPVAKKATVFFTVNNPFQTNVTHSVICDDISDVYGSWLTWARKTDPNSGYSYACTYHEVKKYIGYFPELDVQGVL